MKRSLIFAFGIICLAAALSGCKTGGGLAGTGAKSPAPQLAVIDIVKDGAAKASVVIPSDSTDVEKFAAAEFAAYVNKITGAELKIGTEPAAGFTPLRLGMVGAGSVVLNPRVQAEIDKIEYDGFVIDAGTDGVQIIAKTRRGLLYGVYHLLKKYGGIYWFQPDDEELVPPSRDFGVPCQLAVKNPAFGNPAMDAGIWSPPNRLVWRIRNGLAISAREGHKNAPDTIPMRKNLGGRYATGGHEMTELLVGYFSPEGLMEGRAKLFKEHPEYFGLRDGKRVLCGHDIIFKNKEPVSQPCTSNPEVLKLMVKHLQEYLDRKFQGKDITWKLCNDDYMFWCECENCKKQDDPQAGPNGKHSDRWWTFVNHMAQELLDKNPNLKFNVLAYQDFRDPPRLVKPDPRVIVTICPHGDCYAHMIDDPACAVNAVTYYKMFEDWIKAGATLDTFEYHTQLPGASQYVPVERQWVNMLKFYHKNKFYGFGLHINDGWQPYVKNQFYETYHNKNMWPSLWQLAWLSGHFSWNIDDDYEAVWDDVNSKYYGPAWPAMKAYRLLLEKAVAESGVHLCYGSSTSSTLGACYERPGVAQAANELLAQAEKAAGDNKTILKRVLRDKEFFVKNWAEAGYSAIGKAEQSVGIVRADEKLAIDGKLGEKVWLKAQTLDTFYKLENSQIENTNPADAPTKVKVLYDNDNVYFGFEALKVNGQTADTAQADGLKALSGSHIEIFLLPPALQGKYYQIGLAHNGRTFSALTTDGATRDLNDKLDFECKITDEPDRWFAEVRVPCQKLGGIKDGDFWKINIGRCAVGKDGKRELSSIIGYWFQETQYYKIFAFGVTGPLLLNGDFEDLGAPPPPETKAKETWKFLSEKVPLHWTYLPANVGVAEARTDNPSAGKYYLRIDPNSRYPYVTQPIRNTDDSVKKYFVSMKVRGKGNLQVSIYSNRTSQYLATAKYSPNSDAWQTFAHTFEFDAAGPKSLFIRVATAPLDIDDVRIAVVGKEEMPDAYKHR